MRDDPPFRGSSSTDDPCGLTFIGKKTKNSTDDPPPKGKKEDDQTTPPVITDLAGGKRGMLRREAPRGGRGCRRNARSAGQPSIAVRILPKKQNRGGGWRPHGKPD